MKTTAALLSLFGAALAEGVTEAIAPTGSYPSGCSAAFSGEFEVTVAVVTNAKRDVARNMKRSTCGSDGALLLTLADGVLTDAKNRTGYIASNYQFQFDAPPQAGAIYTTGFSVCGNESLALGDTTTWYQCKSGSFYNLYDRNWAAQCEAVQIIAMPCDSSSGSVSESSDGQVVATEVVTTTIIKPLSDGQPQVITTTVPIAICQIGDGQIQGHTTPCASISAATTAAANTAVPVSQYSDGQIQVTTPAGTTVAGTTAAVTTPAGTAVTTAPSSLATVSTWGNSTSSKTSSKSVGTGSLTTTGGSSASASSVSTSGALRVVAGSFAGLAMGLVAAYLAL